MFTDNSTISRGRKILLALLGLALVGVLIWVFIDNNTPQATIITTIVPQDASIKLNSKPYSTRATQRIKPGVYQVVISKEGFIEYTTAITITVDEPYQLSYIMEEVGGGFEYLKRNPSDNQLVTEIGDSYWLDRELELIRKYPITEFLTFRNAVLTITYRFREPDNIDSFFILVQAPTGIRNGAVQRIYDLGFDPADYIIEFEDYENPFGSNS